MWLIAKNLLILPKKFVIWSACHTAFSFSVAAPEKCSSLLEYLSSSDQKASNIIAANFKLHLDFVTEDEETELMKEIDSVIKRRRYERDHWDGAIQGYKETEKAEWNEANTKIIERLRRLSFPENCLQIKHVHVLDLSKDGYIKPHVDSVKFCGDTIAGISLLSSSVMRLAVENQKDIFVDVLLPQRSLYIMKGAARYNFTHEILKDSESYFKGKKITRSRRVSVICRNEPVEVTS